MIERVAIDPPALAAPLAAALAPELPARRVGPAVEPPLGVRAYHTDLARWADPAWDPGPLDWALGDHAWNEPVWLRVRVPSRGAPARLAPLLERALTRLQRFIDRRNDVSGGPWFDRVLRRHRALHDRRLPLVRADHDHAVDTWRWVLRLRPDASLALQAAALFHDVERLKSEARARKEHLAPDYAAFKTAHARAGAALARRALTSAGLDPGAVAQVEALIAGHERPGEPDDEERALLNDADALSFFSLNASGFLDYYGPDHTRAKVAYTLGRLRPAQRWRLGRLHLRADVLALVRAQAPEVARPGGPQGRDDREGHSRRSSA
ncbi:MAG: DUF4202 family protein [Planctomycetes bacterium]|nr:DUF4202 family protein [Planctomycetota bacterium]